MSSNKKAVFTFFAMTTCGHCHIFQGMRKDGSIDPNGPWETLTRYPELKQAGVEFVLFKFGIEKDPATGKLYRHELPDNYKNVIKGAPYLDLRPANSPGPGIKYNGPRDPESIKNWILQQVKSPDFNKIASNASLLGSKETITNQSNVSMNTASVQNMGAAPPKQPIQTQEVVQNQMSQQIQSSMSTSSQNTQRRNRFRPVNY